MSDLLVMGSQARDGIPGVLIGNIAEKVIRRLSDVECFPVMLLVVEATLLRLEETQHHWQGAPRRQTVRIAAK